MKGTKSALFLIGYRGSGKSRVGGILAERLSWQNADTDLLVEARIGKSITSYFKEAGEAAFRREESAVLAALAGRVEGGERLVVATGGGIILAPQNVDLMRRWGGVVWLVASAATLKERIATDPSSSARRPALLGESPRDEVEQVLARREPLYRAAAHLEVRVDDLSPSQVADRILAALPLVQGSE